MTREKAREAAEVMLAFARGEKIEQYVNCDVKWSEVKTSCCDFNWSKNGYRIKPKEKFDPKTLNPFDKVLVRNKNDLWECGLFSNINIDAYEYKYNCIGGEYCYCIPYNDETKHLIGSSNDAPEYYRHWET